MTGLDLSDEQVRHAGELVARERASVTLVRGSAEQAPFPDASFDVVFCDHGAMTFADPRRTVPEAARVLRPGGLFAFCTATPILELAIDRDKDQVGEQLVNDYFELFSRQDPDGSITFHLPYGQWIKGFRENGLMIEDLVELRPPADAETTYEGYAPLAWARRFPAEHIWKLRREGAR